VGPVNAPSEIRARADELFALALERTGARDPRAHLRAMLLELREADPEGFRTAVAYHDDTLLPAIVDDGADPLRAWLEYGRLIAELLAPGRTVAISPDGEASDFPPAEGEDAMFLHLPASARAPARVLGLPGKPSPAQRATLDLLVRGSLGA
jgi:hypothetical protein